MEDKDYSTAPLLVRGPQPSRAEEPESGNKKLSYFSFIWTTFLLTSAGPFGIEYTVVAVGVGYSLVLILGFALVYAFPISLISSELSGFEYDFNRLFASICPLYTRHYVMVHVLYLGLMPSRHGQIIWAYRAFHRVSPRFGDFIGYLNAANAVIFWTLNTAVSIYICCLLLFFLNIAFRIHWITVGASHCVQRLPDDYYRRPLVVHTVSHQTRGYRLWPFVKCTRFLRHCSHHLVYLHIDDRPLFHCLLLDSAKIESSH